MNDFTERGPRDGTDWDDPVLEEIRDLYQAIDPVPSALYTRVRFALDLDNVEHELATMCADLELAAVRGSDQVRTITFECQLLTIAVTVTVTGTDRYRLDGWIAPPASLPVEIRSAGSRLQASSDDGGRFVFEDVPAGEMRLAVLPVSGGPVELVNPVVTQPIVL
jgi:hypothetical protein